MPIRADSFEPPRFHPARPGLVRPVPIDPAGVVGPTRGQAAGRGWRRTGHGLVLPARFSADLPEQRIVEIAALMPDEAAITGWAALRWLGAESFDGRAHGGLLPVPVAVTNHRVRVRTGVLITAEHLTRGDRAVVDGLLVTSAVRSVCFEMRYAADVTAAVKALDAAAAADLVSRQEAWDYTSGFLTAWTGVEQCRKAIELADENSWSPMEVEMRLEWRRLGIGRILCNHPIFDLEGRHVGTPDLLDVELGVAGEYDSTLHLNGKRRTKDLRREGAFRRVGLEYVTMVAGDRADPRDFYLRTLDARSRARAHADQERRWTVVPPKWWTPTVTVAQRRALSPEQRRRFTHPWAA